MTKYDFSFKDVVKGIRDIAKDRPDFIYTNQPERETNDPGFCSYLKAGRNVEGGEGCIVGQALSALGVSDRDLELNEGENASFAIRSLIQGVPHSEVSKKDMKTLHWISTVQTNQDQGYSWAEAVKEADDES